MPYERIVQWAAGPIAIIAGWLSTQLVQHINVFGSLGVGKNQIAHAIVVGATFIVGTGVTYAAHHKWLSNLPKWWAIINAPTPSSSPSSSPTPTPGAMSSEGIVGDSQEYGSTPAPDYIPSATVLSAADASSKS